MEVLMEKDLMNIYGGKSKGKNHFNKNKCAINTAAGLASGISAGWSGGLAGATILGIIGAAGGAVAGCL